MESSLLCIWLLLAGTRSRWQCFQRHPVNGDNRGVSLTKKWGEAEARGAEIKRRGGGDAPSPDD